MWGRLWLGHIGLLALLLLTACQNAAQIASDAPPLEPGANGLADSSISSAKPAQGEPSNETISTFSQPIETGLASWYGSRHEGKRTANGSRYNQRAFTAAHPSLPFGTWLRVVNQSNNRSVDVVVTDRHPEKRGRIIDLSVEAARRIDMLQTGVAQVALYLPPASSAENAFPTPIAPLPDPSSRLTVESSAQKPALPHVTAKNIQRANARKAPLDKARKAPRNKATTAKSQSKKPKKKPPIHSPSSRQ